MPNHRDLNLGKYNISRDAYRELYYFCRQPINHEIITETAAETDPTLSQYITAAVTHGYSYRQLRMVQNIPICESGYHEIRRKFFYNLAKRKNII